MNLINVYFSHEGRIYRMPDTTVFAQSPQRMCHTNDPKWNVSILCTNSQNACWAIAIFGLLHIGIP